MVMVFAIKIMTLCCIIIDIIFLIMLFQISKELDLDLTPCQCQYSLSELIINIFSKNEAPSLKTFESIAKTKF